MRPAEIRFNLRSFLTIWHSRAASFHAWTKLRGCGHHLSSFSNANLLKVTSRLSLLSWLKLSNATTSFSTVISPTARTPRKTTFGSSAWCQILRLICVGMSEHRRMREHAHSGCQPGWHFHTQELWHGVAVVLVSLDRPERSLGLL